MGNDNKLNLFYNSLTANKNITGLPKDFETFESTLRDPAKSQLFYNSLRANKNVKGLPESYDQFVTGLSLTAQPEQPEEERTGFWEGLGKKTAAGVTALGGYVTKTPQFIESIVNTPAMMFTESSIKRDLKKGVIDQKTADNLLKNKELITPRYNFGSLTPMISPETLGEAIADSKVSKFFEEKGKELNESVNRYDQTAWQYIKNNEYGKALGVVTYGIAESFAPTMAAAFVPAGWAALGVGAGAEKYDEVKDRDDMSDALKQADAITTGIFEALFEKFGTAEMSKLLKETYKKAGKKGIQEIIAGQGTQNLIAKGYKKFGVWFAPIHEGLSESLTTIGQNAATKYSGENPDVRLDDNVVDSFLIGTGMGSAFAATEKLAEKVRGKGTDQTQHTTAPQTPPTPEQLINAYGEKLKFGQTPLADDPQPTVIFADTKLGQKVILTRHSNENGDDLFVGYDTEALKASNYNLDETKPIFIKASDILERKDVPYQEWFNNELNEYNATLKQGADIESQQQSQFQPGQQIEWNGKKWIVGNITTEGLEVDEIDEEGMPGVSDLITPDKFKEIPGYQPQQTDQQQPGQPEATGTQQPQQPAQQARKLKIDDKNDVTIIPGEDENSFSVDRTFNTNKEAEATASKLNNLYPKVDFKVNTQDSGDPFTPDTYTITAKIKPFWAKKASPAPDETATGQPAEHISGELQGKARPEPHQMTRSEYVDAATAHLSQRVRPEYRATLETKAKQEHEQAITKAIEEGAEIPENVMADYPQLFQQPAVPEEVKPEGVPAVEPQAVTLTYQQKKNAVLDHFGGMYEDVANSTPEKIYMEVPEVDPEDAKKIHAEIKAKFDTEQEKIAKADVDLTKANTEVNTEPTEGQKEAGNYKKGHVTIQGLDITIENPQGSVRSGTDKQGNEWSVLMNNSYGYFRRAEGKDGDQVDVFIGDKLNSNKVWIIDQVDPETGSFDEHKVMLGFETKEDAVNNYHANYDPSWKGLGKVTEFSIDEFKKWLGDGKRTKVPASESVPQPKVAPKPKFKPQSRTAKALAHEPADFTEAVLQFFIRGGKVNREDFIRFSGLDGKDIKQYNFLLSKDGVSFDVFNEAIDNSFGMENDAMAMENAIVDIITTYGSKSKMLAELESRISDHKGEQPAPDQVDNDYLPEVPAREIDPDAVDNLIDKAMSSNEIMAIFDNASDLLNEDGSINWTAINDGIDNNPGYFTQFPFGLNEDEINTLKQLCNNEEQQRILQDRLGKPDSNQSEGERDITGTSTQGDREGDGRDTQTGEQPTEKDGGRSDQAEIGKPEELTPEAPEPAKPSYGSTNTVFTADAAAKAREILRKKLGNLNVGIDPETMQAGITLAGYHIEAGARQFSAFAKAMVEDMGEAIKPYLKSFYNAVRDWPGFNNEGMDDYGTVSSTDVDKIMVPEEVKPEPWEMTPDEYASSFGQGIDEQAIAKSAHPQHVKNAIAAGKKVPLKVLEKYRHNYWAQQEIEKQNPSQKKKPEFAAELFSFPEDEKKPETQVPVPEPAQVHKPEFTGPRDGWRNNLFKAREYAVQVFTMEELNKMKNEDTMDWGDRDSIVRAIDEKLNPLLKQYHSLKKKYPDAVLLMRVGDFYETFEKDAEKISAELGIVLTKRNDIPVSGFPAHSLDTYMPKLVRSGIKTGIVDQLEAPPKIKDTSRDISNLVTGGRGTTIKTPKERLIGIIKDCITRGEKIGSGPALTAKANSAGMDAGVHYKSVKELYDIAALALNQYILEKGEVFNPSGKNAEQAKQIVDSLNTLQDFLPTETQRSKEQVDLQQFSTPPALAFLVNWAANVTSNDTALEPSAGEGNIAIFAKIAGAKVIVNEYDENRISLLRQLPFDKVTKEDAKHLHAVNALKDDKVSVVVMNPPFSRDVAMGGKLDLHGAEKHIDAALAKLEDGGRVVAIVGRGMTNSQTHKPWFDKIQGKYTLAANIGVSGDAYSKKGTNFDNRILVIDKTGPATAGKTTMMVEGVESYLQLVDILEQIPQNNRNFSNKSESNENTSGNSQGEINQPESGSESKPTNTPAADVNGIQRGETGQPAAEHVRQGGNGTGSAGTLDLFGQESSNNAAPERPGSGRTGIKDAGKSQDRGPDKTDNDNGSAVRSNEGKPGQLSQPTQDISGRKEQGRGLSINRVVKNKIVNKETVGYDQYSPEILVEGAKEHPTKLVESSAMASVNLPETDYIPNLSNNIVTGGTLSNAQLEDIILAGNAHKQLLPSGERRGFFLGAGTGYGKGRTIAGIILDNWNNGSKKAVWISKNDKAHRDSPTYWNDIGGNKDDLFIQKNARNPISKDSGILLTTYGTLRSGFEPKKKTEQDDPGYWSQPHQHRVQQIAQWLGKDFDGVIEFDESHEMANAKEMKAQRGKKKPSMQALAGIELQRLLPKAKIVYSSATGATEVSNLTYAKRLGLWGDGSSFGNVDDFITAIDNSGVAGMEIISKDLKAMGLYTAKTLSYDGVEYKTIEHKMMPEQITLYDQVAEAWQIVLTNINEALDMNNSNSNAKKNALGAFWGSHQRFFAQMLTTIEMPTVIQDIQQQLDDDKSIVIQLVNTNAAQQERYLAEAKAESEDGEIDYDELDMSPKQILINLLYKSFPVQMYEEGVDADGNTITIPVVDSEGNPVLNPEAVKMRDDLIAKIDREIKLPESPIDMIINTFGPDNVAEVTGRSTRIVQKIDKNNEFTKQQESRTDKNAAQDTNDFMDGKKRILVFSKAGGTGASFHASLTRANQQQRVHYVLQAGWQADAAIQGFGRSHRSNQRITPIFKLVTTNLKAQMRFLSTIARRLEQLRALTKGQRDTGGQGVLDGSYNLESRYAKQALFNFYRDVEAGKVNGVDMDVLEKQMALKIYTEKDGVRTYNENVVFNTKTFLNRIMSLKVDLMNDVFDGFIERLNEEIDAAMLSGTYDAGIENVKAENIKVINEQEIYTDKKTKGKTYLTTFEVTLKNEKRDWETINNEAGRYGDRFLGFYQEENSGKVYAIIEQRLMDADGKSETKIKRMSVVADSHIDYWNEFKKKYKKLDESTAKEIWGKEFTEYPETRKRTETIVKGLMLPIWNKLPAKISVRRYVDENGTAHLGRFFNAKEIEQISKQFNIENTQKYSPEKISDILKEGGRIRLSNGFEFIRTSYQGMPMAKILNTNSYKDRDRLDRAGAMFVVKSSMTMQGDFFVPMGNVPTVIPKIEELFNASIIHAENSKGEFVPADTQIEKTPEKQQKDDIDLINDIFDGKTVNIPEDKNVNRPQPEQTQPQQKTPVNDEIDRLNDIFTPEQPQAPKPLKSETAEYILQKHSKTGEKLHTVKLLKRISVDEFNSFKNKARLLGGTYSRYNKEGMQPGFMFKSEEKAKKFFEQISNSDWSKDVNLLNEKAEEYIKEKGVYTQATAEQTLPEGVSYVSERASNDDAGQLNIWGQGDYNATPDPDNVTYVERILTNRKKLSFIGDPLTGSAKIKGSDDVAFLFKNLENAATENFFSVYVDKDGNYKVLYISTGGVTGTVADLRLIAAGAREFNANKIYLVHNHPSGNMQPSDQDILTTKKVQNMFEESDIDVEHVIIDLDSGQYALLNPFHNVESLDKDQYSENNKVSPVDVYQFDRQKLYVPSSEKTRIRSSMDVAEYLSKMKRGTTPKMSALILDRANNITKYLLYDESITKETLANELQYEVGKHGTSVILASNKGLQKGLVNFVSKKLNTSDSQLLDVIIVKQSDDIMNSYKSWADEGLLNEPEAEYTPAKDEDTEVLEQLEQYLTGKNDNTKPPDDDDPGSGGATPGPSRTPKEGPPVNMIRSPKGKRTELWQNKMLSVRKWMNQIKGRGGVITDISNPYIQENLSHGAVKHAIENYDEKFLSPLEKAAADIMKATGMNYDQLNEYMMAKHARERNEYLEEKTGREVNSGMESDKADEIAAEYEAKMTPDQISEFWKAVNKATKFSVDRWLSDGFISPETHDKIKNQYKYYVPLRNWQQTEADNMYSYQVDDIGKSVNPLKKAKGRTSLADDPMQYIVNMAHSAIVMGEKNKIKQHAARLIRNNKDMKDLHRFKRVYYVWDGTIDEETGKQNYIEVFDKPEPELWEKGYVKTHMDLGHTVRRSVTQAGQHEVDVFIGGDKYTMILPADVAAALNKVPSKWDNVAFVLRDWKIGQFTRWLSFNFTSKNPAFILLNQMRDLQYATLAHFIKGDTREAGKFIKTLPKARKAIIQHIKGKGNVKDANYQMYLDFLRMGGETGYVHLKDVDQLEKEINKQLDRLTGRNSKADKVLHAEFLRNMGQWMEHMAVRSENLSRFATYIVAKEQGLSDRQAAFAAKEITVNFNRKGQISGLLGSLFAFFNASVQGGENIYRMGKEHKNKFFAIGAAGMAMGFLEALFNGLWGGDDEDGINRYAGMNDYLKFNNFVFMVPGTEKFATVPLPHGFRWFHSLGVLAYQTMFMDEKTKGAALKDGLSNLFSSVSPVNPVEFVKDDGTFTIRPIVPTIAVPFYDIAINQTYTGAPVHKTPFTSALDGRIANTALGKDNVNSMVKSFTDGLFKLGGGDPQSGSKYHMNDDGKIVPVSNIFDKNPSDIEHVIEYYLGGRGQFWNDVMKTTQNIIESADQYANDASFVQAMKEINMNEFPVMKSLVRQPWRKSVYTRYYDIVNDIENYKTMVNMNNKSLDPESEAPQEYLPEYQYKIELLKDVKRDLKSLDEDMQGVEDPGTIQEIKDIQERLIRNFIDQASKYNQE